MHRPGPPVRLGLALAATLALARPAAAQPTSPYAATVDGPDPATGLGMAIPVRLVTSPGGAPVVDAGLSAPRLVSPAGAPSPVRGPEGGVSGAGVYRFRGDLPLAGAWTLSFTVTRPGAAPADVTLGFTAAGAAPSPFPVEPRSPSFVAGDPTLAPAGPVITAPGPSPPSNLPQPGPQ